MRSLVDHDGGHILDVEEHKRLAWEPNQTATWVVGEGAPSIRNADAADVSSKAPKPRWLSALDQREATPYLLG